MYLSPTPLVVTESQIFVKWPCERLFSEGQVASHVSLDLPAYIF